MTQNDLNNFGAFEATQISIGNIGELKSDVTESWYELYIWHYVSLQYSIPICFNIVD